MTSTTKTTPQTVPAVQKHGPALTSIREFLIDLVNGIATRKVLSPAEKQLTDLKNIIAVAEHTQDMIFNIKRTGFASLSALAKNGYGFHIKSQSRFRDLLNTPFTTTRVTVGMMYGLFASLGALILAGFAQITIPFTTTAVMLSSMATVTALNEVRYRKKSLKAAGERWNTGQDKLESLISTLPDDAPEKSLLSDFAKAARIALNTAYAENGYKDGQPSIAGLKAVKLVAEDLGLDETQAKELSASFLSGTFNREKSYLTAMTELDQTLSSVKHAVGAREIALMNPTVS